MNNVDITGDTQYQYYTTYYSYYSKGDNRPEPKPLAVQQKEQAEERVLEPDAGEDLY
jgi:hypothetical protein